MGSPLEMVIGKYEVEKEAGRSEREIDAGISEEDSKKKSLGAKEEARNSELLVSCRFFKETMKRKILCRE